MALAEDACASSAQHTEQLRQKVAESAERRQATGSQRGAEMWELDVDMSNMRLVIRYKVV